MYCIDNKNMTGNTYLVAKLINEKLVSITLLHQQKHDYSLLVLSQKNKKLQEKTLQEDSVYSVRKKMQSPASPAVSSRKFRQQAKIENKNGISIDKMITLIMRNGEKSKASQIFYKTLTLICEKISKQADSQASLTNKAGLSPSELARYIKPEFDRDIKLDLAKQAWLEFDADQARLAVQANASSPKQTKYLRVYPVAEEFQFNSQFLSAPNRSRLLQSHKSLFTQATGLLMKSSLAKRKVTTTTFLGFLAQQAASAKQHILNESLIDLANLAKPALLSPDWLDKTILSQDKTSAQVLLHQLSLVSKANQASLAGLRPYLTYDARGKLLKKYSQQIAFEIMKIAVNNVKPSLSVRKVRIAGTTYQVPCILDKKKSNNQAFRWIIESARTRKPGLKSSFSICLAQEFLDAFQKMGKARQKRDHLHNLALANRAYVRYRWW